MGTLEDQFHHWAAGQGVQPCPKCGVPIIKIDGCNHMTCPGCAHEWCWLCRERYTPDHYAAWNINGCAGRQFRDMSPEQLQRRMRQLHEQLHDASMSTLVARYIRSRAEELLHGACLPHGLVAAGVRSMLGPGLGSLSPVPQLEISQRRMRESARLHFHGLIVFLFALWLQVPMVLIGLLGLFLLLPRFILLPNNFKSKNPVKAGAATVLLAVLAVLCSPVLLVGFLLVMPATWLMEMMRIESKWRKRLAFAILVILTPPGYVVAIVGCVVVAVCIFLVGPSVYLLRCIVSTEAYRSLRYRFLEGRWCRLCALRTLAILGAILGAPFAYIVAILGAIAILWVSLHVACLSLPLVLAHRLAMKDEWFIGSGSFRGDFPDPLLFLIFAISAAIPGLPTVPGHVLCMATHGLLSLTVQKRILAGTLLATGCALIGVTVVKRGSANHEGFRWSFQGFQLLMAMLVWTLLAAGVPLAAILTKNYMHSLREEGTAAHAGVKPPAILVFLFTLPACVVFVPVACLGSPVWFLSSIRDVEAAAARCWLVHWASVPLLPSELLLNVFSGPACALSGRVMEASGSTTVAKVAFWVAVPVSPLLYLLALLAWVAIVVTSMVAGAFHRLWRAATGQTTTPVVVAQQRQAQQQVHAEAPAVEPEAPMHE